MYSITIIKVNTDFKVRASFATFEEANEVMQDFLDGESIMFDSGGECTTCLKAEFLNDCALYLNRDTKKSS